MRRSLVLSALLCALVAGAAPAFAQDRTGTFEMSPFGGAYFGGQLYDSSAGNLNVDTNWAYGVRFAYNVNRVFAIEGDWTHAKSDMDIHNHGCGSACYYVPNAKVGKLTQDVYEANAIFNLGKGRVYGYVGLGAGASVLKTELNAGPSDSQTRFTGNFSAGMKAFVTPHFGFRLDGRLRSTNTDQTTNHGTTCDYYGYCYHYHSTWYYSSELTGGLIFAF
jgi:hypothetical protein